ncbi:MAG TPA: prolyl oligopeptidase family serine peptidase [Ilumatobacteraceae bacterium]|nr:prolyl oligopeptidase family serine peptidase [Ilumatobacteraceae bacterium]
MSPPPSRRDEVVDTLHGVAVADPYRWLEDGASAEVQEWVTAQNLHTRRAIDSRPDRSTWHEHLIALMELPVVLAAEVRGDVVVTMERRSGEQQASLVARSTVAPDAPPLVLVDPAAGAADAAVAVDWFFLSPDGSLVAYGVSEGGTESSVLRVIRTADASDVGEVIPNTRACTVGWEPDGSGIVYTRYPEGDEYHRTVHVHRLGADWRDDPVLWSEHPTPETWPDVTVSADGRHVLVQAMVGWSRYDQHLLDRSTGEWTELIVGVEAISRFEFGEDGWLYGVTTHEAPRGRVVRIALDAVPTDPSGWETIVAERSAVLGALTVAGDSLLVVTSANGVDAIERRSRDGELLGVFDELGIVSVGGLTADPATGTAFAITAGFDSPATLWRLGHESAERWQPAAPSADALPPMTVRQVEYPSADGTTIGLFLVHRSDVAPGPDSPAILTGYGGFAIAETPVWSPTIAAWCASGGTYAIAQLRGGFEHGEEWHLAGRRAKKQNVFDDFAAAADWMVSTEIAARGRLAIVGGSNGGLLVGATLTQRPDVCRAVWCAVPLLDMIRFPQFLIAKLWTDEYGDPEIADEFGWLHAYSPYHQVSEGTCYPAVLLTSAEGDTRVDPLHARKMAGLLQWASSCQAQRPVLYHQEGRAGHGVGKPVGKRAAEQADVLAFLSWQLGVAE